MQHRWYTVVCEFKLFSKVLLMVKRNFLGFFSAGWSLAAEDPWHWECTYTEEHSPGSLHQWCHNCIFIKKTSEPRLLSLCICLFLFKMYVRDSSVMLCNLVRLEDDFEREMVAYLISLSCFVVVLADDGAVFLLVLFRTGGKTPDPKLQVRSYMDVMREQYLSKEEVRSHPVHSNLTGMQKFY